MSTQAKVRVFSPFRNRDVDATREQASILRQVKKVLDFYTATASERSRLQQAEWKGDFAQYLLGDLEMLDTTVAGVASWCQGSRSHPDPSSAIQQMMLYDIPKLSKKLHGFPKLHEYLCAMEKLRAMVVEYLNE